MTDQELNELRREKWHLTGRAVRTFDDARSFLESVGFCLMYPMRQQALLPTFIGAWVGSDQQLPDWQHAFADPRAQEATELMVRLLRERAPDLEVDGEMQADTALSLVARKRVISNSWLEGEANVLIFPNLDAGSTALQLTRVIADALPIGPILIGPAKPAHVLTPTVTARGIVNMTAIAAAEAASEPAMLSRVPNLGREL